MKPSPRNRRRTQGKADAHSSRGSGTVRVIVGIVMVVWGLYALYRLVYGLHQFGLLAMTLHAHGTLAWLFTFGLADSTMTAVAVVLDLIGYLGRMAGGIAFALKLRRLVPAATAALAVGAVGEVSFVPGYIAAAFGGVELTAPYADPSLQAMFAMSHAVKVGVVIGAIGGTLTAIVLLSLLVLLRRTARTWTEAQRRG